MQPSSQASSLLTAASKAALFLIAISPVPEANQSPPAGTVQTTFSLPDTSAATPALKNESAIRGSSIRLSNGLNEVAKLVQARMRTDVLLSFIETSPTAFRLNADEIIHFQALGATPEIIEAMIRRGNEVRAQVGGVRQRVAMPGLIHPAQPAQYDASPANLAYPAVQLDYNYPSAEVPFFVARPGYGYSYPVISSFLAPIHPASHGKPDSSSVLSAKAKAGSQAKDFFRDPKLGYSASRNASSLPPSGYYQTWSGYSYGWTGYSASSPGSYTPWKSWMGYYDNRPWQGYSTPWKGYYTPWTGYYTPWTGFLSAQSSSIGLQQGMLPSTPTLRQSGQGQQVLPQPNYGGMIRPGVTPSSSGFMRGSPNRGFLPASGSIPSGGGRTSGSGRGGVAGMPARSGGGKG